MPEIFAHLPVLLKMSAEASVLILLVLAAQRLLGRRLKPRWRYALWLLVLLRLVLPWTIPSPVSLFNLLKMPAVVQGAGPEMAPVQTEGVANGEPIPNVQAGAVLVFSPGIHWLAGLWATGALLLTTCGVISQYKFRRRVGRLRPLIDEPTLRLLEDCKAVMEVSTPVTLMETDAIKSPTLFGFVRPHLLLPRGLASTFTREELRHVFLHELAHIKRFDILTGWVTLGLQIVHWFNPLVWLAFHRLRTDRELACDALALSYARIGENESYGLTIVKLLEGFGQSVGGPGLAGILEDKQQMRERIRMIAKFHKADRGLGVAVVLLAGLALVTLTDAQSPARPQPGTINDPRLEKQVEYSSQQASVQDIVRDLAGQAGLKYDWQKSFNQTDPLCRQWVRNVTIAGQTCRQALEQILKPVGLRYEVEDGVLSLSRQDGAKPGAPQLQATPGFAKPDASQGVWAVRFEPVGDFAPKTPGEFLAKIPIYSGQHGEIGYFRTTKQGDKLVGSFLANDGDELKAALDALPGIKVTSVEKLTAEQLVAYENSPQETLSPAAPPRIVATSPVIGATDVDPALTEITVTFDQDMGGGMSWTGGGPDFPPGREGQKAYWRDHRTCVFPVKLEAGKYYRVGINSRSYRHFASDQGEAAEPSAIYFTTQGAGQELKARVLMPQAVRFEPPNGAGDVSTAITELRVTFNVPMGGGYSWCTVGDTDADFPKGVAGKSVHWTGDQKTCVLPVDLKPGMTYRLSLNADGYNGFQSDAGVPLKPVIYTFTTTAAP